jgi:hypothetical protein
LAPAVLPLKQQMLSRDFKERFDRAVSQPGVGLGPRGDLETIVLYELNEHGPALNVFWTRLRVGREAKQATHGLRAAR